MKKYLQIVSIVLVLAIFAAFALGSSSDSGEVKVPESVSVGGVSGDNDETDTDAEKETDEEETPEKTEETIEEMVLVDEAGIKITAKSLETDGFMGPALKLLIENETEKNLTVQVRNVSVNGYMVETLISADVAAGKKANDEITFTDSDLEEAGISTIADIELSFHIFDSETWDTYLDSAMISIKTTAAEGFVYEYDNSGDLVYNENGVEIVIKGLADEFLGQGVVVYVSNTSQRNVCVQVRDVSINGFMVDPIFSTEVCAGKHAIGTITFLSSELEENEITAIEDIELSFHIFDNDTWATIADTDVVAISFGE